MHIRRVPLSAILAAASIAFVVAFILADGSSREASASDNGIESEQRSAAVQLDERSAVVATSLPLFQRLDRGYIRGAEPASGGVETLSRLGVRTVVDLRSIYDHTDDFGLAAETAGLRYYWLPMSVWDPPTDQQAKEFMSLVSDESGGPFYVFCADGLHRTGEMSAIYRVARHGWSVEQALKEMDEVGFNPYYYSLRGYVWTYARKFCPRAVPPHARRVSAFE